MDEMGLLIFALVVASVGGITFALVAPLLGKERKLKNRQTRITSPRGQAGGGPSESDTRDARRKAVQESLKQFEASEKKRKRLTLRKLILQAGVQISLRNFWIGSILIGVLAALMVSLTGAGPIVILLAGFVAALGVPRWILGHLRRKRQTIFLMQLPDAVDIMVRGLKSGLPINDAMLLISSEMAEPLGPEFREIVEGQRIGIPLDQGLDRLYERVPVAEVNFLAIVIGIQSKTGGNLSEALGNLARVLRDRKKMKSKIRAVSQEAKSSAAIIGALPPLVMLLLYLTRPDYVSALWLEPMGQVLLAGSVLWMLAGILVMRKMINFNF